MQGFQILEARLEDSQKKLATTQGQARSSEESVRSTKERIHEVEEQVFSAETRNAELVAVAEVVRNELTTRESVRKLAP